MSVDAPIRLVALAIPIALLAWYAIARSRRSRTVVRFTSIELAEQVATGPGWRRWITAGAGILGAIVLAVAFARPIVAVPIPQEQASLILAVDVSLSMGSADVEPSRIEAAQDAAARFTAIAPNDLNIGLVAFAGTALPVLAPDTDRRPLATAIERLGLGQGTAIGEAIFTSLDQLETAVPDPEVPRAIVILSDSPYDRVDPVRTRKLLLHRREIRKLVGKLHEKGIALIPLRIYFIGSGKAKVELGLARGKKLYDKRASLKQKQSDREVQREILHKGK